LGEASGAKGVERFRLIRELGSRAVPTWAALDSQGVGRNALVVVERIARGGEYQDDEIGDWVRDARRLHKLEHPNIAKVRDVVIGSDEVLVASEYVDGVRWSELTSAAQLPSLEVTLRVFIDVLTGLNALHGLRDEQRQPLKLSHGELTPDCIVVGPEGVSRVVSACRVRSATARPGRAGSAYLAPEILLADDSADSRADVYSTGVMLWEALSGRPLFPNTQPAAIVTHLLSGRIPKAKVPEGSPWAEPLVDIVKKALSVEPDKRFESAAALAGELKRVAGARVATSVRAAAFVRATFGDRIRQRREALERGDKERIAEPPKAPAAALPAPPLPRPAVPAPPAPVSLQGAPAQAKPAPPKAPSLPPPLPAAARTRPPPPPPPVKAEPASEPELISVPPPIAPMPAVIASPPPPPLMPMPAALAAPRLPADLVSAAAALNDSRAEALVSSIPAAAPLTGLALEDSPSAIDRRRTRGAAWFAPVVLGLAIASGAGIWWALGRKGQPEVASHNSLQSAAATAQATAASTGKAVPSSEPPAPAPSSAPAPATPPTQPAAEAPTDNSPASAPGMAPAAVPRPQSPQRTVTKGRYIPEGI
jgi:hypothetical protein